MSNIKVGDHVHVKPRGSWRDATVLDRQAYLLTVQYPDGTRDTLDVDELMVWALVRPATVPLSDDNGRNFRSIQL